MWKMWRKQDDDDDDYYNCVCARLRAIRIRAANMIEI